MPNFNKVILAGHITRELDLRYAQSGTAILQIGLAVTDKYGSGENRKEKTCFVDCTAFGKSAEIIHQYVGKGDPILIEGRLELSQWKDKKTGDNRSKLGVVVESFQFLGSPGGKRDSAPPKRPPQKREEPQEQEEPDYGDIPF